MAFNFKKALALSLSAAMVLTAAPFSGLDVQAAAAKKVTVKVGATKKVTLKKKATKSTIKYAKAAQKKIVKVSYAKKTGKVSFKGLKAGSATVTVKLTIKKKTVTQKYKVTVKKAAVVVNGVSLSNNTPTIGDTVTAKPDPENATNVASYSWLLDGKEVGTSASYKITEDAKGKTLQCVITDKDGKEFRSAIITVSVQAAQLLDVDGLQTDGTGYINDTLRVTYTADLGNPSQVTWYRDGTAILTQTAATNNGLTFELDLRHTYTPGAYYATITTGDGKNFTSNSINLSATAQRVTMSDFTITDYTEEYGAAYQDFDTKDSMGVVTVKLNRMYEVPKFYLFRSTAKTFASGDAKEWWDLNTAGFVEKATKGQVTDKAALDNGRGIYWIDPLSGEVSLKFVTHRNNMVRGESYKLVVDQTEITEDDAVATNKNVNITSNEATAPYLPELKAVAVTTLNINGANAEAKATVYLDEAMTQPAVFLGSSSTGLAYNAPSGTTPKLLLTKESTAKSGTAMNDATSQYKQGETSSWIGAIAGKNNVYAEVKTTAGVFGKNSVTLTSAVRSLPAASASAVKVSYDKKKKSDLKVEIDGIKTDGVVAVIRMDDDNTSTGGANWGEKTDAAKLFADFDLDDPSTYAGKATVSKLNNTVMIEGVVDKIHSSTSGADGYFAVFVPNNKEDFSVAVSAIGADNGRDVDTGEEWCLVKQEATTYKLGGTYEGLATGADTAILETYDQFGDVMNTGRISADYDNTNKNIEWKRNTGSSTAVTNITFAVTGGAPADPDTNRKITLTVTGTPTKDDKYTYKIEDGAYLVAKCTDATGTGKWEFSIAESV